MLKILTKPQLAPRNPRGAGFLVLCLFALTTAFARAANAGTAYTWNGASGASWNVNANWTPSTGFPNTGDTATFDSTKSGIVDIPTTITPTSITVNATTSYTFQGVGEIGGAAILSKQNSGTLTVSNANTYTGGTTLIAGTLAVGNNSAIGTGNLTFGGNATIQASGGAISLASTNNFLLSGGSMTFSGTNALTVNGTTTVSGSGHTIDNSNTTGSPSLTFAGKIYLAESDAVSRTLTFGSAATASPGTTLISGVIANNSGANTSASNFVAGGGGTVILSGANTYSGTTSVVNTNSTLQVGNGSTTGNLGAGAVTVTTANLSFKRSDTITVGNAISGTGTLTQAGSGTTILTGSNSYSATTISAGTLQVGNGGASGTLGSGAVTDNAALSFNRSDAVTVANVIGGTGALSQIGGGTTTLSAANTYTGATTISNGILSVSSLANGSTVSNIGSSANAATNLVFDGGTLQYTGATTSTNRNFTINSGKTATIDVSTAATTSLKLTGAGTATTGTLIKTGAGTLLLNGNNLYTGGTTMSAGTLSGSGTIGGPAVFNSGSTHAPGNSPGIQTVNGDYNLNSGSTLQIEINGTTPGPDPGGYDQVVVNGGVNLNGGNVAFSLGYAPTVGNRYVFVNNDGTDAVNGTFNGLKEGATFNLNYGTPTSTPYTFQITYHGDASDPLSTTGNDIVLTNITQTDSTTSVALASFNAISYVDGTWLKWRTGFETDNLGFNVYREAGGQRSKLNSGLIGGSSLMSGALASSDGHYAWPVGTSSAGSRYWLEDVDVAGHKTLHGPVSVQSGKGDSGLQRSLLLGQAPPLASAAAKTSASTAVASVTPTTIMPLDLVSLPSGDQAKQWLLAGQAAIKIEVQGSGWYRVTQAQLAAAGLDSGMTPGALQLYAEGREVPILVSASGPSFGSGDYIEFYAQGLDTLTTDTRTYWMPATASGATGLRIATTSGGAAGTSVAANYLCTAQYKPRTLYYSSLRNGSAGNFFGEVINSGGATLALAVPDLATKSPSDSTLILTVQGVTTGAHKIQVQCNGIAVGSLSFSGAAHKVGTLKVPASALHSGSNTFTLTAGASEVSLLDCLTLRYPHLYRVAGNSLTFTATGGASVRLDGFSTTTIAVLDITDPAHVTRILPQVQGSGSVFSASLKIPGSGTRTLLAYADGQFRSAILVANHASNWNSNTHGADLVVIAHRSLVASLAPLVTLRRHQGLATEIVNVDDVFDEFSYGAHDPLALRRFMSRTRQWSKAPRYLILAGDSSYDARNYLGQGAYDLVPTRLIDTASMETASDDAIVDFDNDGLPGLAVGRLPARNASEASVMVNKIINYAGLVAGTSSDPKPQGALLVSDNTRGYNFKAASDAIADLLPSSLVKESINRGDGDAATVHAQVVGAINAGPLVTSFYGHGSVDIWTGGEMLSDSDTSRLSNGGRFSLFLPMTCLNGYFMAPGLESLGESLLKAPNGGGVAVWASSGITDPEAQFAMDQSLIKLLFPKNKSTVLPLGDAVRAAKAAINDMDVRRTWILMGDPTMQILPAPIQSAAEKAAKSKALKAVEDIEIPSGSFALPTAKTPSQRVQSALPDNTPSQ